RGGRDAAALGRASGRRIVGAATGRRMRAVSPQRAAVRRSRAPLRGAATARWRGLVRGATRREHWPSATQAAPRANTRLDLGGAGQRVRLVPLGAGRALCAFGRRAAHAVSSAMAHSTCSVVTALGQV